MKKVVTKKKATPKKVIATTMAYNDKKWQAEDDARTLMRAEEIKRDKARINAAQAQAKKQMEELAKVIKK